MMRLNQSIIDITTKQSQNKIDSQEALKLLDGLVNRLKSLKKKVNILNFKNWIYMKNMYNIYIYI